MRQPPRKRRRKRKRRKGCENRANFCGRWGFISVDLKNEEIFRFRFCHRSFCCCVYSSFQYDIVNAVVKVIVFCYLQAHTHCRICVQCFLKIGFSKAYRQKNREMKTKLTLQQVTGKHSALLSVTLSRMDMYFLHEYFGYPFMVSVAIDRQFFRTKAAHKNLLKKWKNYYLRYTHGGWQV